MFETYKIHRNARSKVGGVNKRIRTKEARKIAVLFWVYENLIWQYVNSGRHLKGNLTFFVNDVLEHRCSNVIVPVNLATSLCSPK